MAVSRLEMRPIDTPSSYRSQAYRALKEAITALNPYAEGKDLRLDERRLSQELGVSRTPIREAMSLLEQEGFVKTKPRRGTVLVRKTKKEIVEMIQVWAALESLAARLATLHASADDIAGLRRLFDGFQGNSPEGHLDEYSDANIRFHQAIIQLSGSAVLAEMTKNLFIHVRAIRQATIGQDDRARRSIVDHINIIEALERRDTEKAGALALQHTLDLATHVEKHVDYLD
ncbi:MAG TPA: GntR family transcriptional regulator [Stellaceae bacterium]|nr:GntR family transcriptional regulator [Stellaceae bacterium]